MTKKSLRVLQVANRAGPLYVFMIPLCRELDRLGAQVELACMPGEASWQPLLECGLKVHALPLGRWGRPSTWWKVYREIRLLVRKNHYDLMIVHTPAMSWVARPAAHKLVPATIYFSHGLPFAPEQSRFTHNMYRFIERFMARYTHGLIVMNSDDVAACKRNRLTRDGRNCRYVPGVGVDIDLYDCRRRHESSDELAEELGLCPDKPMVLYLGRFIRSKRPADVLEVARRVGDKADFVMAGEGPLWSKIKAQAGLVGPHVKVIEFTRKAAELICRCSVVVLPSMFREGLPRILLETYAAGKVAVAYNIRGVRDVIENGKTGILVRPGDVDGFCQAVDDLLDDDKLRKRMGQLGQKRVRDTFSMQASLCSIMESINQVLGEKTI